jgi:hypothetical protein
MCIMNIKHDLADYTPVSQTTHFLLMFIQVKHNHELKFVKNGRLLMNSVIITNKC